MVERETVFLFDFVVKSASAETYCGLLVTKVYSRVWNGVTSLMFSNKATIELVFRLVIFHKRIFEMSRRVITWENEFVSEIRNSIGVNCADLSVVNVTQLVIGFNFINIFKIESLTHHQFQPILNRIIIRKLQQIYSALHKLFLRQLKLI